MIPPDSLPFQYPCRPVVLKKVPLGRASPSARTNRFTRSRSWARLKSRTNLRRRRRSARTSQTTFKWLCLIKLRRPDGSVAQTVRSRARGTWRVRCVTMSRLAARYAQLIKMCRRRGCPPEDAKELVQEAHRRLYEYQRTTTVRDAESLLRRIVINLSITYFHRELSAPNVFVSVDRLDRHGLLIDPAPSPERVVAAEQQLDGVIRLLDAVSPRTCLIFIAQRGGYSYEELAAALGVKPRTIEKHVASAMLALREIKPAAFTVP
jgi:RNA polymerase sigma factor (sigma-70 family)